MEVASERGGGGFAWRSRGGGDIFFAVVGGNIFLLTVQEIFFSVGERRCPDRGVVSSGEKKRRLAFSPYHTQIN